MGKYKIFQTTNQSINNHIILGTINHPAGPPLKVEPYEAVMIRAKVPGIRAAWGT